MIKLLIWKSLLKRHVLTLIKFNSIIDECDVS